MASAIHVDRVTKLAAALVADDAGQSERRTFARNPVQSLDLEIERRLILVRMNELQHMLAPVIDLQVKDAVTRYQNTGVRIEDSYIITDKGLERISANAPRELEEIETLMKKRSSKAVP